VKHIFVIAVLATILAASGLGYAFLSTESNRRVNEGLDAEIEAINSDLTSLGNKLTTLNSSLTQLSQNLGKLDSELQNEIEGIQANVSSLVTQVSNLQSNVSAIQKDITNVHTDITKLWANVTSISTQISNIQKDISVIQSLIANLQDTVASLEARVSALEAERLVVIRVNFIRFEPHDHIVGDWTDDYLIDIGIFLGDVILAQGRTGHSRFIKPEYLDLVIRNGSKFVGSQVTIKIYAYWHLDDMVIDIDPDPAHGRTSGTNPSGGYLTLTYTIGATLTGAVDGNDDDYILDQYDAYFEYKIETLL